MTTKRPSQDNHHSPNQHKRPRLDAPTFTHSSPTRRPPDANLRERASHWHSHFLSNPVSLEIRRTFTKLGYLIRTKPYIDLILPSEKDVAEWKAAEETLMRLTYTRAEMEEEIANPPETWKRWAHSETRRVAGNKLKYEGKSKIEAKPFVDAYAAEQMVEHLLGREKRIRRERNRDEEWLSNREKMKAVALNEMSRAKAGGLEELLALMEMDYNILKKERRERARRIQILEREKQQLVKPSRVDEYYGLPMDISYLLIKKHRAGDERLPRVTKDADAERERHRVEEPRQHSSGNSRPGYIVQSRDASPRPKEFRASEAKPHNAPNILNKHPNSGSDTNIESPSLKDTIIVKSTKHPSKTPPNASSIIPATSSPSLSPTTQSSTSSATRRRATALEFFDIPPSKNPSPTSTKPPSIESTAAATPLTPTAPAPTSAPNLPARRSSLRLSSSASTADSVPPLSTSSPSRPTLIRRTSSRLTAKKVTITTVASSNALQTPRAVNSSNKSPSVTVGEDPAPLLVTKGPGFTLDGFQGSFLLDLLEWK